MDDVRKLVYSNVANGVPLADAAHALGLTEAAADAAFDEVGRKLAAQQIFEETPLLSCQTRTDAMVNRRTLLILLERLDLDAGRIARLKHVQIETRGQ